MTKKKANEIPTVIAASILASTDTGLTAQSDAPTVIDDSILTGIFIAKKHRVIPGSDEKKHVYYSVYGDVEKSLREIYNNENIGCLDVYNGIKQARAMIWALKSGGQRC